MQQPKQQQQIHSNTGPPYTIGDSSMSVDNIRGWKREQLRPWLKLMKIKESGTNAELAEKLIERMYPETAEQQKENNSQSSNQQEPTIKRQQSKPLASILKKPKDFGMQQQSADSLILNSLPNRLDELNDENNEPDLYMSNRRNMSLLTSLTGGPKWRPKKKGYLEDEGGGEEVDAITDTNSAYKSVDVESPTALRPADSSILKAKQRQYERREYLSTETVKSVPFINSQNGSTDDSAYKSASVGSVLTMHRPEMTHVECQTIPENASDSADLITKTKIPEHWSDYYTKIVGDLESVTRLLDHLPLPLQSSASLSSRKPVDSGLNPAKLALYCVCHGSVGRFHANEWGMLVLRNGEIWLRYDGYKMVKFTLTTLPQTNQSQDDLLQTKFDFSDTNFVCPDCVQLNNSKGGGDDKISSSSKPIVPLKPYFPAKNRLAAATNDDGKKQQQSSSVLADTTAIAASTSSDKNLLGFASGPFAKNTAKQQTNRALLAYVESKIPTAATPVGAKSSIPTKSGLTEGTPVKHASKFPTTAMAQSPRVFNESPRRMPTNSVALAAVKTSAAQSSSQSPLKRQPLQQQTHRTTRSPFPAAENNSVAFRPSRTLARTPPK